MSRTIVTLPTRVDLENASLLALFRQEFGDAEVISRLEKAGSPLSPINVHRLFSGLRVWIKKVAKEELDSCLHIIIDWAVPTDSAGQILYDQDPAKFASADTAKLVHLAADGTVIDSKTVKDPDEVASMRNLQSASNMSKKLFTTVFHYDSGDYTVLDEGPVIESKKNLFDRQFPRGRLSEYYRPIAQWDDLLSEHFRECVQEAAQTKHWQNKNLRILRSAPEDIFKGSLWWYLNTFTLDALKVKQEYPVDGGGVKPVDVCVMLANGDEYFFEVKWLGKAQGGKSVYPMDDTQALAGKDQLINYLNSSQTAVLGCCVVYDGRNEDVELDWSLCKTHQAAHHKRFYLVSINPSTESKKDIAEAKKLKKSSKKEEAAT